MEILSWLFGTGKGVAVLIVGGMVLFTIIAFLSERKTHKLYFNHPDEEGDDYFDGLLDLDDEEEEEEKSDK